MRWLSLTGRLLLAAVFIAASVTKVGDPQVTVRAVRAYQLVPEPAVRPLAYALPYVELALAVLLLLGLGVRYAAAVSGLLLVVFIAGVASAWARGLQLDCGCFGDGGPTDNPRYTVEIVRDTGLLVVAGVVTVLRRSAFSLDSALSL